MIYILLDLESGNYMATYHSEAEALADVRETVAQFGRDYVSEWALAGKTSDGTVTAIAEGEVLIERALHAGTVA